LPKKLEALVEFEVDVDPHHEPEMKDPAYVGQIAFTLLANDVRALLPSGS
jgi:hypothetical protein